MCPLIAIAKIIGIALLVFIVVLVQLIVFLIPPLRRHYVWIMPRFWHRCVCGLTGIKITMTGTDKSKTLKNRPVIYVSNHTSYLDILALGTFLKGIFIAKSEIAGWPIFGFLSKLQGTYFIERKPSAAIKQKEDIRDYLNDGVRLLFFPEGTTNNGFDILPFKSSLFGATLHPDIMGKAPIIQTISLKYYRKDGSIITQQSEMDDIAWYLDTHELTPHLWAFLKTKGITANLHFGDMIDVNNIVKDADNERAGRKLITQKAEDIIRADFENL